MKNILITGGAGYIGSHMCKELVLNKYNPVIIDNFIDGHEKEIKYGTFIYCSIENKTLLQKIFSEYKIDAVLHFAGLICVKDSTINPIKYYNNNVNGTINLLESMINNNINKFVFSSSCAIYGNPIELPIVETHPKNPISPYGRTKLIIEQILEDFKQAYGLKYTSLRYFNVSGADIDIELGEDHFPETHLIPLAIEAAFDNNKTINIFGNDYNTKDGTCVRDYIHVNDLVKAHILAMEKLLDGDNGDKYNLGNGNGYSVKEIIEVIQNITNKKVKSKIINRRSCDSEILISSNKKAFKEFGWLPKYDLDTIIGTSVEWYKKTLRIQ